MSLILLYNLLLPSLCPFGFWISLFVYRYSHYCLNTSDTSFFSSLKVQNAKFTSPCFTHSFSHCSCLLALPASVLLYYIRLELPLSTWHGNTPWKKVNTHVSFFQDLASLHSLCFGNFLVFAVELPFGQWLYILKYRMKLSRTQAFGIIYMGNLKEENKVVLT